MRPKMLVFIVLFVLTFGVWKFFRSTKPNPQIEEDLRKFVPQEATPRLTEPSATPRHTGSAVPKPMDGTEYVPPTFTTSGAPNQGHIPTFTAPAPPVPTPVRPEDYPARGIFGGS